MKLILASASPRRRSLMRAAGYTFKVVPSRVRETRPSGLKPSQLVKWLAKKKAMDIAQKYPSHTVLGADTLVYLKGRILGKPRNNKHAIWMLKFLSGSWQSVYTGVSIVNRAEKIERSGYQVSKVKLRKLSSLDIKKAIQRHMDKAGAYAVQQKDDPFVEKILGDYDNVVGLPIRLVKKLLRRSA